MTANIEQMTRYQPKDDKVFVWRYMDLAKFISMLSKKSIFFSRPDCLSDSFEGTLSRAHAFPGPVRLNDSECEISIEDSADLVRHWYYINCWHMNKHESAAMWKLYAKSEDAVAVRTTYKNLSGTLSSEIEIGLVKYVDFDEGWSIPFGNANATLMHKRLSFEHENEVRLLATKGIPFDGNGRPDMEKRNPFPGGDIPQDIENIIDDVFVAPNSKPWFFDVVTKVIDNFGFSGSFELHQSKLDDLPY